VKFIHAHRQDFGVEPLCAVIGLQVSTFYDRLTRAPSARSVADEVLACRIEKIWVDSGQTYGAPRVHAQLARDGIYVGRKRVERIMADRGVAGCLPAPGLAGHHPPRLRRAGQDHRNRA
jgi:putative transposase